MSALGAPVQPTFTNLECPLFFFSGIPKRFERSEAVERLERFERLERTDPYDERPHPGRSGTRVALELLEPMEPYVSEQSKSLSVDSSLRILANQ